jgi:threonine dehydrogenase-like Zn-dependent dehydrogenase
VSDPPHADHPATMHALRYRASVPHYALAAALGKHAPVALAPLDLVRLALPEPRPGWRRLRVRLTGICGSDMALLFGKGSPRVSAFLSFPAVLGHEILAELDGSRVVVNPTLACAERGLEPCEACRRGDDQLCANVSEGDTAPGFLGFHREFPGGWSEAIVASERRVHAVADAVPDERAMLAEPFAVAWRGVRLGLRDRPRHVLVVGGGSIGLATLVALRLAGFVGQVHAIARHPYQREAAREAGADRVHTAVAEASAAVGARSYPARIGPPGWRGGFDLVIDAAGSRSSLDTASWAAREGGTVVLLGAPGFLLHDLTPHWFREVSLVGSYTYTAREFAEAVERLPEATGLDGLAITRYGLSRYREALRDVRQRRVAKGAFEGRP